MGIFDDLSSELILTSSPQTRASRSSSSGSPIKKYFKRNMGHSKSQNELLII